MTDSMKKPFRIREIATAHDGTHCATVDLEGRIWVWDLTDGSLVSKFKSCYSMGGRRLAITPDGTLCAAADYQENGIAAYCIGDGTLLWRRKDITKTQFLSYDPLIECFVACFDNIPCDLLERGTGRTIEKLPHARRRTVSPYDDVVVLAERPQNYRSVWPLSRKGPLRLCGVESEETIASIDRKAPEVLEVAFGPGIALIAEMTAVKIIKDADGQFVATDEFDPPDGGPLRAVSIVDGKTLWEHWPGKGTHFLRVCYNEATKRVHGLARWEEQESVCMSVVSFNTTDGRKLGEKVFEAGNYPEEFALKGQVLITSRGEVFDLTGEEPHFKFRLQTPE